MPVWGIVLIVLGGVLLLLSIIVVSWIIKTYNSFIRLKNNVDESFSTMDVFMKKRYDLIPNLVETVKGYTKHENSTLEAVMKARYSAMNAKTPNEKMKGESALSNTIGRLFKITENYPDLKANTNFMDLQIQLKRLEEEIANSRKYYNGCVKMFNTKAEVFPSNLIARHFKFEQRPLFEIENKEERIAPKVKF